MNLLRALFDLRFDQLISRQLLGVVYAIALTAWLLTGAVLVFVFATGAPIFALGGVVVSLAGTLVGALGLRVTFEALAAYFRMADDVQAIRATPDAGAPSQR